MIAYTLQAHGSFQVLGNQVQAIRDYLAPERIVVVQGPYLGPLNSKVRLTQASADTLGVEILEAPNFPQVGPMLQRPLFAWVLEQSHGSDRVILQADTFPIRPMTMSDLLAGHLAAGRGYWRDGKLRVEYTWLAVSKEWVETFTPPYWEGDFKIWPVVREGEWENCEPGWWHADRINTWHIPGGIDRFEEVRRRYPTQLVAETEPAPIVIGGSMPQVSTTGDHLHRIFKEGFHQDFTPSCSCRKTMEDMNNHPPEWSAANREMIVGKIKAEMKNRGWWGKLAFHIPGISKPLEYIVSMAIARAKADALRRRT